MHGAPPSHPDDHPIERASTTDGLPVSLSLGPTLEAAAMPSQPGIVDRRVVFICFLAILIAVAAAFIAQGLMHLIWFWSPTSRSTATSRSTNPLRSAHHLGAVGDRHSGDRRPRRRRHGPLRQQGHPRPRHPRGDGAGAAEPEPHPAADDVSQTALARRSPSAPAARSAPRARSSPPAARSVRSIGQILSTTAAERKTLLAAGAAAGMAATFGSPVSAVLLAIELLLFEFRPRSIIPVALAAATAAGVRIAFDGADPVFAMPDLHRPRRRRDGDLRRCSARSSAWSPSSSPAPSTRSKTPSNTSPIHWMWWPAIGAVAVGVVGYFSPRTLGVGYDNITGTPSPSIRQAGPLTFVAGPVRLMKFISWSIALGSGTSGGTLAPAVHHRQRPRRAARRGGGASVPGAARRPPHRRPRRHGGDLRRGVTRAARRPSSSPSKPRSSPWASCRCSAAAPRRSSSPAC